MRTVPKGALIASIIISVLILLVWMLQVASLTVSVTAMRPATAWRRALPRLRSFCCGYCSPFCCW